MALLIVAGLGFAFHYQGGLDVRMIRDAVAGKPFAPLIFIVIHMLASLFFVPRTLLAIAAGLIWGLWWGSLWTMLGALAGSLAGFGVTRYLNAGFIKPEKLPRIGRLLDRMERGGWRSVAFLRLVPVMPHTPVNYAFGLTKVTVADYLFGSLIGLLPMTLFAVDVGTAGGGVMTGGRTTLVPALIGLAALGVSLLVPRFFRPRSSAGLASVVEPNKQ